MRSWKPQGARGGRRASKFVHQGRTRTALWLARATVVGRAYDWMPIPSNLPLALRAKQPSSGATAGLPWRRRRRYLHVHLEGTALEPLHTRCPPVGISVQVSRWPTKCSVPLASRRPSSPAPVQHESARPPVWASRLAPEKPGTCAGPRAADAGAQSSLGGQRPSCHGPSHQRQEGPVGRHHPDPAEHSRILGVLNFVDPACTMRRNGRQP